MQVKEIDLLFEAMKVLKKPFDAFGKGITEDILDVQSPIKELAVSRE